MGILVRGLGFQIGHTRREENERLPNLISESFGSSNQSRSIESQIYPIIFDPKVGHIVLR
jgi:hypothetical protein